MYDVKKVRLGEICRYAPKNTSLTKDVINKNKGKYPVYAASVGVNIGTVDTFCNEEPSIIIPTAGNGSAGRPYIVKDKHYSIANNAVGLIPEEDIDLDYLFFEIKKNISNYIKGDSFKNINKTLISNVEIEIPIDTYGNFDLEAQKELAKQYIDIEERKKKLLNKVSELKKYKITFEENNENYVELSITELFSPKNGDSTYTKEWCQKHKGEFPLYSGNTVGVYDYVEVYDYDGEYITWAKDGFAGYLMYHNGKFALTVHRGVLIPTEKCVDIDLQYIKYILEPIFRDNIKGRMGINGKNEYTTLNCAMIKNIREKIKIPVKKDGTFDLEKQKELAFKYASIETIKNSIQKQVNELLDITVE